MQANAFCSFSSPPAPLHADREFSQHSRFTYVTYCARAPTVAREGGGNNEGLRARMMGSMAGSLAGAGGGAGLGGRGALFGGRSGAGGVSSMMSGLVSWGTTTGRSSATARSSTSATSPLRGSLHRLAKEGEERWVGGGIFRGGEARGLNEGWEFCWLTGRQGGRKGKTLVMDP